MSQTPRERAEKISDRIIKEAFRVDKVKDAPQIAWSLNSAITSALLDKEVEIDRLKEYEWKYKELCK